MAFIVSQGASLRVFHLVLPLSQGIFDMPVAFSVAYMYICCALYALKLDTPGAAKCLVTHAT